MRKRIISQSRQETSQPDQENWLNLEQIAEVEITSEDTAFPIEAALLPGKTPGWRAAGPGEQTIRLLFDQPRPLRRIRLEFVENNRERLQEYVLRWSPDGGRLFQEIVRQQWNFSPAGSTREVEDHEVDLPAVTLLELSITPDAGGGGAVASLSRLRIA